MKTLLRFAVIATVITAGCDKSSEDGSSYSCSASELEQACLSWGGNHGLATPNPDTPACSEAITDAEFEGNCIIGSGDSCEIVCTFSGRVEIPDGIGSAVYDDDGDCYCEEAPCTGGSSNSDCTDILGGDCMDDKADIHPGAEEICDAFDNDCDGDRDGADPDTDTDGDGYSACDVDCDDTNPDVHPDAAELCDEIDNDCDGRVDGADRDTDVDGDGFSVCDLDCDDTNAHIHPNALELCDEFDNDCDGDTDADDTDTDIDGDGFSHCADDCNDYDISIFPGAEEICDLVDNNCDGLTDEEDPALDADGDGFHSCVDDCDDSDALIHPDATELCDDIDNDCDGHVDAADPDTDQDGDGASSCTTDCDDSSASVHEGLPELCDGVDNDCDGAIDGLDSDTDRDSDGHSVCDGDCQDGNPAIHPAAEEICDLVDNNCDGLTDEEDPALDADGDGFHACVDDCDDSNPDIHPTGLEVCDGVDNDCDGYVDAGDADTDADGDGASACATDCDDTNPAIHPGVVELCDGIDNDCDGAIDAMDSETDRDLDGYSACAGDCQDEDAAVNPAAVETCDDVDNDCDGYVDDADDDVAAPTFYRDADGDGWGDGSTSLNACFWPDGYALVDGDCLDSDSTAHPGADETCDGLDNDCDGFADELDEGIIFDRYYQDRDDDGYGDPATEVEACEPPGDDWVSLSGDCDDDDPDLSPETLWYPDYDGDGFGDQFSDPDTCEPLEPWYVTDNSDCNDEDGDIKPGAVDFAGDGVDDDCDGHSMGFVSMDPGKNWGCGLTDECDGNLYCWGYGSTSPSSIYSYVQDYPTEGRWSQVSAGYKHACAVEDDGHVTCWGDNSDGQTDAPDGTFVKVLALSDYLGSGSPTLAHYSCGLKTDGSVTCWGRVPGTDYGMSWPEKYFPADLGHFTDISGQTDYWCGLRASGAIDCFGKIRGRNWSGSTFYPHRWADTSDCTLPCADDYGPPSYGTWDAVSVGYGVACALSDGEITCWAAYDDEDADADAFVDGAPGPSLGPFVKVEAGYFSACAQRDDNEWFCWGRDGASPVGEFADIALGIPGGACGILDDGTVECWGVESDFADVEGMLVETREVDVPVAVCDLSESVVAEPSGGDTDCPGDSHGGVGGPGGSCFTVGEECTLSDGTVSFIDCDCNCYPSPVDLGHYYRCDRALSCDELDNDDGDCSTSSYQTCAPSPCDFDYDYDIGSHWGSIPLAGVTSGWSDHSGSCGGADSADSALLWEAPRSGMWEFTTAGSSFDTVLLVYTTADCTSPSYCDDNGGSWDGERRSSRIRLTLDEREKILIVVDGATDWWGTPSSGSYRLKITHLY